MMARSRNLPDKLFFAAGILKPSALLAVLLSCFLLTGSAACSPELPQGPCDAMADTAAAADQTESAVSGSQSELLDTETLRLINDARSEAGLVALKAEPALARAAEIRAREASVCWSHTRPDGSPWYTAGAGTSFGENLAKGFNAAGSVVAAWLRSPSHASNILCPKFRSVWIAAYRAEDGTVYEAAEFSCAAGP